MITVPTNIQNTQNNIITELQKFDTTPHSEQLYRQVLQGYGYNMVQGLGDIVDNSIDADATNISILFKQAPGQFNKQTGGGYVEKIYLIDNGHGMNSTILQKSFIFATKVPHKNNSLGFFGAGGSAASFTIADNKTVLTKEANGQLLVGSLSKDSFGEKGSFKDTGVLRPASNKEKAMFMEQIGVDEESFDESHGTIIELSAINSNLNCTAKRAAKELRDYCSETYHKFIDNGISFKIVIKKDEADDVVVDVKGKDPLMHNIKDATSYKHKDTLLYVDSDNNSHTIEIAYSILANDVGRSRGRGGGGGLIEKQGMYVYRNDRLIVAHSSLGGLWRKNVIYRSGRVAINIPSSLNHAVGLTSTKNKVVLTEHFKEFLSKHVGVFRSKLHLEAQTPTKTKEQIQEQEQKVAEKVRENGSTFSLPELEAPAKTARPNPESGRGPDKKKRAKKTQTHTGRQHAPVKFIHSKPNAPTNFAWWYSITDNQEIEISINTNHPIIVDEYLNGSDDCKALLRKIMVANVTNQIMHQDNATMLTLTNTFHQKLTDSHNLL